MKRYLSKITTSIRNDLVLDYDKTVKNTVAVDVAPFDTFLIEEGIHEVPDEVTNWEQFKLHVKNEMIELLPDKEKTNTELPDVKEEKKNTKK